MSEKIKTASFDAVTSQTLELDLTVEELNEIEILKLELSSFLIAKEAKAEARTSALAKLAALGLTEEEIAAL
jgi:hypothetical protein